MRINEHICVSTENVVLVPYSAHHVPKYHGWMKDPEIQEATASEPLTLQEEYAMQRSWREDGDKLTFIICQPFETTHGTRHDEHPNLDHATSRTDMVGSGKASLQDEIDAMIGDVNLFISTLTDDEDEEAADGDKHNTTVVGELELMIADAVQQRKGYGRAALVLFLNYIVRHEGQILDEFHCHAGYDPPPPQFPTGMAEPDPGRAEWLFDYFAVKIGSANHRSIALFESLGFRKTREDASYFGEYELRLSREKLRELVVDVQEGEKGRGILQRYALLQYSCACDRVVAPGKEGTEPYRNKG